MARRRLALVASAALALVACSSKHEPPPAPPPVVIDAGVIPIDGITEIGANDPNRYLDPDPAQPGLPGQTAKQRKVPARPIDIMLKSTPSGALVQIDNNKIGKTPTYWFSETDGREHEFTFTLPGYALGRYRFVPVQSGTVHARLEPVSEEPTLDAGVADPVTVQPNSTPQITPANPGPPAPVKPPDTVLSPGSASGAPGSGTSGSSGSAGSSGSSASGSKIGPQP